MNTTYDAFLGGRFFVKQPTTGHRSGTDAVLLASYCKALPNDRVVDLGAGVGVAGLCLKARVSLSKLLFIEINPELCAIARENSPDAEVLCADIRARSSLPANSFDHVICNPPYNPPSMQLPDNEDKRLAHEGIDLIEWVKTAAHLLHAKGHLTMIDRPERLHDILTAFDKRFGGIEITPVFTGRDYATRLLIRAEKGVKTPLQIRQSVNLADVSEKILRQGESLP